MTAGAHNGTPSSKGAAFYEPWVRDAAERGLRLISYDRPGYGDSTPHPGRSVADTAGDVRAICAELGVDRLGTWGFSGGGRHVLACAALLPDLMTAAASLASLAPFDAEGLDWFTGMDQDYVDAVNLYLSNEAAARLRLDKIREERLAEPLLDAAGESDSPEMDVQLGARDFRAHMRTCSRAALAPGSQGWLDDNLMQFKPWGFDVADITVPVLVLHGKQDMFASPRHGEWLAEHIPGAEARMLDDYGHGSLAQNLVPEAHAWLSERR